MRASILIVSYNRAGALDITLSRILSLINSDVDEILIFLNGADSSYDCIRAKYPAVKWFQSSENIGASPARKLLYKEAKGDILFGFDDDSHPLNSDFITKAQQIFNKNLQVAGIAFEEIKGIFTSDDEALQSHMAGDEYYCNSFVGCGFAIRKKAYFQTDGFPDWMDIYGEEACVAIQLVEKNLSILYTSAIAVNHRVDRENRKTSGRNTFRFEKQLCNGALYYLVFYPSNQIPKKLIRLFWHNFTKYAITDYKFFTAFSKGILAFVGKTPQALKRRNPVSRGTLEKIKNLPLPKFG